MSPTPTNYTLTDGGEWLSIEGVDISSISYAAVLFSDGTVWDDAMQSWIGDLDRDPFVPDKPAFKSVAVAVMGRPTKYRAEFCDMLFDWGCQGKSKNWMAGELSISVNTLDNWAKEYPDFLNALEIALAKSQQWWEDSGQNGMVGKSIDGSIWSRSMAARFPLTWRDKTETETTINKGDGWDAVFAAIGDQSRTI